MKSNKLEVASVQIRHKEALNAEELKENLAHSGFLMKQNLGSDIYLLPELSCIGYGQDSFNNLKKTIGNNSDTDCCKITRFYIDLAIEVKAHIGFGLPVFNQSTGRYFITYQVVSPNMQVVHRYDKIFLCDYGDAIEGRYFDRGLISPSSFEINGIRFGTMICADQRFPEVARYLASDLEVDVILHPCAFSKDGSYPSWHQFAITRALENQVYLVSTNFAGNDWGGSITVPPWVDDDSKPNFLEDSEKILLQKINPSDIAQSRKDYQFSLMREQARFDKLIGSAAKSNC